jgi:acetyl esterase/lipase
MRLSRVLLVWAMFPAWCLAADEPQVIPLWPSGAPGSEGKTDPEVTKENGKDGVHDRHISRVHNPTLTVYLPPRDKANGAAVVICPGGGHRILAIDHEGYDVARRLNEMGVAGIVLKYRLARTEGAGYKVDVHALADARRAIRLVRSRADEWGIDPGRVGLMGFSAGGELTALASTKFEPESAGAGAGDPIDRLGSRPDFQILIYPGGRPASFEVTKESPPAFLLVAADDRISAQRTVESFTALRKAGVLAELHV